jgi:NADH-ubiquinone oxidoreductase-F iron-sulfur binding region
MKDSPDATQSDANPRTSACGQCGAKVPQQRLNFTPFDVCPNRGFKDRLQRLVMFCHGPGTAGTVMVSLLSEMVSLPSLCVKGCSREVSPQGVATKVLGRASGWRELAVLPELGETLALTSICGLGQVALQPALSVLRYWPEEAGGDRPGGVPHEKWTGG